jgi:hypothetical protein
MRHLMELVWADSGETWCSKENGLAFPCKFYFCIFLFVDMKRPFTLNLLVLTNSFVLFLSSYGI